jgi:hypothetical protein
MIKFENIEVIGWEHAIHGMRNPLESWEKSDSCWYEKTPNFFDLPNEVLPVRQEGSEVPSEANFFCCNSRRDYI